MIEDVFQSSAAEHEEIVEVATQAEERTLVDSGVDAVENAKEEVGIAAQWV